MIDLRIYFRVVLLSTLVWLMLFTKAVAQIYKPEEPLKEDTSSILLGFDSDQAPTVELNPNEQKVVRKGKKKQRKKKVFYGVKTKRRFIYTYGRGGRVIQEKFHIVKPKRFNLFFFLNRKNRFREPDPFVFDKYYYGTVKERNGQSSKQILMRHDYKPSYGAVMHGTYEKTVLYRDGSEAALEKGIYYFGTKHGRWQKFRESDSLITDKEKWYKGFPKDAVITYYDTKKERPKEVIPFQLGEQNGIYLRYFESGRLAEVGTYLFGQKVGVWTEYYDREEQPYKKKTQYRDPKDMDEVFAKRFDPTTLQEWGEDGRVKSSKKPPSKEKSGGKLQLKMPGGRK